MKLRPFHVSLLPPPPSFFLQPLSFLHRHHHQLHRSDLNYLQTPHQKHLPSVLSLMASQSQQEDLRQRPLPPKEAEAEPYAGNDVVSHPAATTTTNVSLKRHRDSGAMAKRGIRSPLVALSLPLSLTLSAIYLFGHRRVVPDHPPHLSPSWYPSLWMMHGKSIVSAILMGLSAWMVWAEGGFHRNPQALPLYLAQLGLSLAWHPIMSKVGANWLGLAVVAGLLGTLVGCYMASRNVNPIAGNLVMLSA